MSKKYYKTNLLKPLEQWDEYDGAEATSGQIELPSGASALCDLDIDFEPSSLTQSDIRRLVFYIIDEDGAIGAKQQFNWKDHGEQQSEEGTLQIFFRGSYIDPEIAQIENNEEVEESEGDHFMISISPNTINYKKYDSETNLYVYAFNIDMQPMNLSWAYLEIDNQTNHTVVITKATMRRSKDVSQLDENTLTSIQISGVKAYKDGMEVKFDNVAETMKCWWESDGDTFTGIDINHEKNITFQRIDGLLTLDS